MGGDTFEGVQKLTNEEFQSLVPKVLDLLSGLYIRAEVYVPLPEKEVHGDVDFLMIMKEGCGPQEIISTLQMERYLINNNNTINSVYQNKQIDFCLVESDEQFDSFRFYKSYGGLGAYLGMFLPSKEIKLNTTGLFAIGYQEHHKFQFLLTKSIQEILTFYGMSFQRYMQGFETRKDFFEFMRTCRFLDERKFAAIAVEDITQTALRSLGKLNKQFIEYLNKVGPKELPAAATFEDPKAETLKYFHKAEQFQKQFEEMLLSDKRRRILNKKFNATHMMERFKISAMNINPIKKKFKESFGSEDKYLDYIEEYSVEEILEHVSKVCQINETGQTENVKKEEKPEEGGGKKQNLQKVEEKE